MAEWLVFYVEGEFSNGDVPYAVGGDWVADAKSAKDALKQSQRTSYIDTVGCHAYAVRIKDCEKFESKNAWERAA